MTNLYDFYVSVPSWLEEKIRQRRRPNHDMPQNNSPPPRPPPAEDDHDRQQEPPPVNNQEEELSAENRNPDYLIVREVLSVDDIRTQNRKEVIEAFPTKPRSWPDTITVVGESTRLSFSQPVLIQEARQGDEVDIENALVAVAEQPREDAKEVKSPDTSCCICLGDFEKFDFVAWSRNNLDCPHVFHHHCLLNWLERKDHCPVCRRSYGPTVVE